MSDSDPIGGDESLARCSGCAHFSSAAAGIETALPGLGSLSSAYASVRWGDGLCAAHDRYVSKDSGCDRRLARRGQEARATLPRSDHPRARAQFA